MKYYFFSLIAVCFSLNMAAQQQNVIPNPVKTQFEKGYIKNSQLVNCNPLGVIICSKINGLDIGQDTEFQYLEVAKQTNIYVKYSKKLF